MHENMANNPLKTMKKGIDLADEFADVLFVLMCLANQTGVDLTDALQKKTWKRKACAMPTGTKKQPEITIT